MTHVPREKHGHAARAFINATIVDSLSIKPLEDLFQPAADKEVGDALKAGKLRLAEKVAVTVGNPKGATKATFDDEPPGQGFSKIATYLLSKRDPSRDLQLAVIDAVLGEDKPLLLDPWEVRAAISLVKHAGTPPSPAFRGAVLSLLRPFHPAVSLDTLSKELDRGEESGEWSLGTPPVAKAPEPPTFAQQEAEALAKHEFTGPVTEKTGVCVASVEAVARVTPVPPVPAAMDPEVGILERMVPVAPADGQDGPFRVSLRDLHAALEVGSLFANWVRDRIEQLCLLDNEDYRVYAKLGENPLGGRPSVEYLVTLQTARRFCMNEHNERGRQLQEYFAKCEEHLIRHHRRETLDLDDPVALRDALLRHAEGRIEDRRQLVQAQREVKTYDLLSRDLGRTVQRLSHEVEEIERETSEQLAEAAGKIETLSEAMVRDQQGIPLSEWADEHQRLLGLGPRQLVFFLQAMGRLEAAAWDANGMKLPAAPFSADVAGGRFALRTSPFIYGLEKPKAWRPGQPPADPEPVDPRKEFNPFSRKHLPGEGRVLAIMPDYAPKLFEWLMGLPETVLWRMTAALGKGERHNLRRLKGRWVFDAKNDVAWDHLRRLPKEKHARELSIAYTRTELPDGSTDWHCELERLAARATSRWARPFPTGTLRKRVNRCGR